MATWSEVRLGQAEGALRLDAEFWQPEFVHNDRMLDALPHIPLADLCFAIRKGVFYILADDYADAGIPFYRSANVGDILPRETDLAYITEERDQLEYKTRLARGDIALAKTARIGACLIMRDRVNISQDVIGLKVDPHRINPGFLTVFLSCAPGTRQIRRWFQGQVQGHLSLPDVRQLKIPVVPDAIQSQIGNLVLDAARLRDASGAALEASTQVLRQSLGLSQRVYEAHTSYSASLADVQDAARMDAEFFQPRFRELLHILRADGTTVGDYASLSKIKFVRSRAEPAFSYIEIGGVRPGGLAEAEEVPAAGAPGRAQWVLAEGDVISSTVRPIRRLTAVIRPGQTGHVCSSGFAVLRPAHISPETLLTFLRLPEICQLLDLYTTASMYPALNSGDFINVPMPRIPVPVQHEIGALVQHGWSLLGQSGSRLEAARRLLSDSLAREPRRRR